jgi:hypothetical protein
MMKAPLVRAGLILFLKVADPVDIPTGIYLRSYIDISIYDTVPIMLKRQYRNRDSVSRGFGIGTSHVYDWYLWTDRTDGSFVDLILEHGDRVHYVQQNPGTTYRQWVFVNKSSPISFLNSQMRWEAGRWKVTLTDGTVYKFLPCGNHTRQKCRLARVSGLTDGKVCNVGRDEFRSLSRNQGGTKPFSSVKPDTNSEFRHAATRKFRW